MLTLEKIVSELKVNSANEVLLAEGTEELKPVPVIITRAIAIIIRTVAEVGIN